MKTLFTYLCCFLLSIQLSYATYNGRVYIDNNASGSYDKGDDAIPNVVVTDGQHTAKTKKDGTFTLPGYEKTRFISVTTPSGYTAVHRYIPTKDTILSYDFILTPDPRMAEVDHSFIQITDTEIHNRGVATNWVDYLKQYIQSEKVAFLMHTGDICYESGLNMHIQVVNTQTMGCPVYYGIGNHDLVKGEYGEQLYESIYGPSWYSFDVGNVHYVMTPMASGDYKPSYEVDEVYRWLKNDLGMMSPDKQLVVFNHDLLTTSDQFFFGPSETERIDLRDYNLKAWIYGHFHINYVRNQGGVYTVCTSPLDKGGIDHSASAFRVVKMGEKEITDMSLHYCFIDHQTVIAFPLENQPIQLTPSGNIPLSVNAYHSGCEVERVGYACRIGEKGSFSLLRKMDRKSDWNWYAEIIPPRPFTQKTIIEVAINTEFSDGKFTTTTRRFEYIPASYTPVHLTDNWTNLLNNAAHTGNITASLKLPLQQAWIANLGSNVFMSSPLIVDNRIFVGTTDDSNLRHQGIYALDAQTGKIVWKYPTRNSIKNSIAYDQGTIFAQDANSFLYAVDARTGKLKWEKQLSPVSSPYLVDGLITANGWVYAGSGPGLGAYRVTDGEPLWINNAWKKNEGTTMTLTLGNGVLTTGAQWGAMYGHDAQTGDLLWKLSKDGLSDRGASTTLHDGKFYVISRNSLFVIEPRTGEIVKQKTLAEYQLNVTSTPLITDTEIVFGTADVGLVALDKESLHLKWVTPTGQSLVYTSPYITVPSASIETSPVYSNGVIYFGAADGCLYGLKAGTGEVLWKAQTGAPVFASVAVSGNTLVAADFSGNVYTFTASTAL